MLIKPSLFLLTCCLCLSACEKSLSISDEELVKKIAECQSGKELTPGMAVACGNFQKECQRRGKKTGNYIC